MKILHLTLVCAALAFAPHAGFSQTPAFPGAEGGGMYTVGGRGGRVLYVTKLTDDGTQGTLRWALSQKYPRTVLFKVSGEIALAKPINIMYGDLTIAGQSAPGDGICISNHGVQVRAGNVIIRYMRFRMGDRLGKATGEQDALGGRYQRNIIVDHCSMSWSTDECVSFYANENFTLQWTILTESLRTSAHSKGSHGYGGIWGGKNASFHHNLLSCHDSRNPRFDHPLVYYPLVDTADFRGVVDYRNNVVYNWGNNSTYGGEGGHFNMINNYYKPGPATSAARTTYFINSYGRAAETDGTEHDFGHPVLYLSGNVMVGDPSITRNNHSAVKYNSGGTQKPLAQQPMPINGRTDGHTTTQNAEEAFLAVLKYAGACIVRDTVDRRAVWDAANGTASVQDGGRGSRNGLIDTQEAVGGWPVYNSLPAPEDTDGDGMPDAWEKSHGLDAGDPADGALVAQSGYTNLELYLNSLVDHITGQSTAAPKAKKSKKK